MTRTRASARDAGTAHTRSVCAYLATTLGNDGIEPRNKNGSSDRGDVTGLKYAGQRIVVEAKNYGGVVKIGPWLAEAEVERRHDGAGVGLVVAKRRGTTDPGEQIVLMTLADLVSLLTGERPT